MPIERVPPRAQPSFLRRLSSSPVAPLPSSLAPIASSEKGHTQGDVLLALLAQKIPDAGGHTVHSALLGLQISFQSGYDIKNFCQIRPSFP